MTNNESREQKVIQVILEKVEGMKLDLSKVNMQDETYGEAKAYNEALDAVIEMLRAHKV
jgi:hypothetical protein